MNKTDVRKIKAEKLSDKAVQDILNTCKEASKSITAIRNLCVIWPQSDAICYRLCEFILDIIPSLENKNPLLEDCLRQARKTIFDSLTLWRNHEITDDEVLTRFINTLVQHAADTHNWEIRIENEVTSIWQPVNNGTLRQWQAGQTQSLVLSHFPNRFPRHEVEKAIYAYLILNQTDAIYPLSVQRNA